MEAFHIYLVAANRVEQDRLQPDKIGYFKKCLAK